MAPPLPLRYSPKYPSPAIAIPLVFPENGCSRVPECKRKAQSPKHFPQTALFAPAIPPFRPGDAAATANVSVPRHSGCVRETCRTAREGFAGIKFSRGTGNSRYWRSLPCRLEWKAEYVLEGGFLWSAILFFPPARSVNTFCRCHRPGGLCRIKFTPLQKGFRKFFARPSTAPGRRFH